MAVKIGHASIDENGKAKGGVAGDQTGKEVCIRDWYNKPFTVLLRPNDENVAEKSAYVCEVLCNGSVVGYDQNQRNTLHTEMKKVGYDPTKLTVPCETDCSAFMTLCAIAAGVTELEYSGNAPTTSTMSDAFVKTGKYQKITDSKYLTSDQYLKRGDILVKPGSHTIMVLTNGANAKSVKVSSSALTYPYTGCIDVSSYNKITDYQKVKDSGVKSAILKVVKKDNTPDNLFETHYSGFTKVGVPIIAVYNYSYATNVEAAKITAQKVISILGNRMIPICLDVEDNCQKNLGTKLIDIINGYQKVVEDSGRTFILYTGLSFYNSYIKPYQDKLRTKNIWIARYYNGYNVMTLNQSVNEAYKPNVQNLVGWQYTSSCEIPGINGKVDANIVYAPWSSASSSTIKKGIVTANALNIRNKPNTTGAVVGVLHKGDTVQIYGQDSTTGWYQIGDNKYASYQYIQVI